MGNQTFTWRVKFPRGMKVDKIAHFIFVLTAVNEKKNS